MRSLLILTLTVFSISCFGQVKGKRIKLLHANSARNGIHNGEEVIKLKGKVKLAHENIIMSCDSAYLNESHNTFTAFNNVHIFQKDNKTDLYGDSLFYSGETKKAEVRGNVLLKDEKMTLRTQHMDFLTAENLAYYFDGGVIVDDKNRLESDWGFFNTVTKIYSFKKDVKLDRELYQLVADTLIYNSISEVAYFHGPTTITHPERTLYAEDGEYHTKQNKSYFKDNAVIETKEYIIKGDSLYYENLTEFGYGFQNVHITSIKDTLTILGDECFHWGDIKKSKVFGHAKMLKIAQKDTFYLRSDTLLYHKDTIAGKENIWAYKGVRFLRREMKGLCDSLNYDLKDSIIHFVGTPIIWSGKSQITSDSLELQLRDNKPYRLYARLNAYIISQDTLMNFNQVKGRDMTAYFKDSDLDYVNVDGNGKSIYYAIKDEKEVAGMNKTICSNMIINFENNELTHICFITEPDAQFIPPQNILEPETRFKGFLWHIEKQPTKAEMVKK